MIRTELNGKQWESFKKFADRFYNDCVNIAVGVAGTGNVKLSQILLQEICPDLLTLYDLWIRGELVLGETPESPNA